MHGGRVPGLAHNTDLTQSGLGKQCCRTHHRGDRFVVSYLEFIDIF